MRNPLAAEPARADVTAGNRVSAAALTGGARLDHE